MKLTQVIFTCSNSTIETLEKGVKYVQSQKKHQNDAIDVVLVFLILPLNIFHTIFYFSIVEFEQVNVSWVGTFFFRCV